MRSKWFTILVALFIVYAFANKAGILPKQVAETIIAQPKSEDKHDIINTIKSYATLLTSEPQGQSLEEKPIPIIKNDDYTPHVESKRPVTSNEAMQDKIANVVYNVLHTKQGQELMEKFLSAPRVEKKDSQATKEPNPYNNNSILNILEGEGAEAECGDTATAHYVIRLMSGQVIEDTHLTNKPKTFQIGNQQVIKGLEYAVIGMKKGGIRRLITLPRLAYIDTKFSQDLVGGNEFVTIEVELIDIQFALDDWQNKIKIFQKANEDNGQAMLCSNEIYFNYKISNAHEQVIAQSKTPVHFTLGSAQVPAAINKAFSGIKSRAQRIVMIPSSLLYKKKVSFLPMDVKLPPKEMLIFEINTNTGNIK